MSGSPIKYKGAKFYKCDFQMNTPADHRHWMGEKIEVGNEQDSANAYIKACYEAGLEVIGITDHNFASKDYIPYLLQAIQSFKSEFGYEIVLFPGFETEANVGKGLHVLALFDPQTPLDTVDHALTSCGVDYPRYNGDTLVKSQKSLSSILEIVQQRMPSYRGMVICPHSQSDAGIFDNERISDWLQKAEYTNENLYCLEIPKAPEKMSKGWQHLLLNSDQCQGDWKRRRQIACIRSSDCKKLRPLQAEDSMYIGWRSTWIKMSEPSIEALRQAFLDPESRIYLGEDDPNTKSQHGRIVSVSIKNTAFLEDTKIAFSPNLNVLIGGRGTGKSTILEYLRLCLDQASEIKGADSRLNLSNIKKTISQNSSIDTAIEKDSNQWTINLSGSQAPTVLDGPQIPSLKRFFPVTVFSQKEVYAVASDRHAVLRIIDATIEQELESQLQIEAEIIQKVEVINRELEELPRLKGRLTEIDTDLQSIQLKLDKFTAYESVIKAWQQRKEETDYVENLMEQTKFDKIRQDIDAFAKSLNLISEPSVLSTQLKSLLPTVDNLIAKWRDSALAEIAKVEQSINNIFESEELNQWFKQLEEDESANVKATTDMKISGVSPELVQSYIEGLQTLRAEREDIENQIARTTIRTKERDGSVLFNTGGQNPSLIKQLHSCWKTMAGLRASAAQAITDLIPETKAATKMVEVQVSPMGDLPSWLVRLLPERKDGRRVSDEEWNAFMTAVFETAHRKGVAPAEILSKWIEQFKKKIENSESPWLATDKKSIALCEWLTESIIQKIRLHRIPEKIEVKLFRQDGSLVGELFEGSLSVGQKCTAVLALIFAKGTNPLIVDQPEDDLDGEFVYRELVPVIRKMKSLRQLIIATHNPNIPVNSDAELVIPLDVISGKGVIRTCESGETLGTIDHHDVQIAVKEILEGSHEAFRKRSEKYGF